MKTQVTFRHFKSQHPELHDSAIEAAEGLEKFYDGIISADVEFINDTTKTVEFRINIQGTTLVASESADDFHRSLGDATDKIVRQLRKWKTKHSKV